MIVLYCFFITIVTIVIIFIYVASTSR